MSQSLLKKRFFNFAAAVSLLMLLVCGVLWVASYSRMGYIDYNYGNGHVPRTMGGYLSKGTFRIFGVDSDGDTPPSRWRYRIGDAFDLRLLDDFVFEQPRESRVAGIVLLREKQGWGHPNSWALEIPLWHFAFFTLPLPLLWLVRRYRTRAARRQNPGLCRKCGYDLRGITSQRCPECGTPRAAGVSSIA